MKYSLIVIVALCGCQPAANTSQSQSKPAGASRNTDLAAARKSFTTTLTRRGPAPQQFQNTSPPPGVKQVEYNSGNLKLKGWLSVPSDTSKKHPAVVFLHGGFAFGEGDWEDAEPFAKAGFVLFMPMLRGENGNPGHYEGFYGEVDDAIAAGHFLTTLPQVDSKQLFVTGHSVGGGLTSLVAMMPSPFKAAASLDGTVEMSLWAASGTPEELPFNARNAREVELRNPSAFAASLRIPLKLYAGSDGLFLSTILARQAKEAGKECELVTVTGDHQAMVKPAVEKTIVWFRQLLTP
jgi:dipeptidyl aminopeptidase/acylaminoacyl peptidase